MIVVIASMARSGSMWAYNVTRAVLKYADKTVYPKDIPTREISIFNEAFQKTFKKNEVYCIKTHNLINPNLPKVKIIFTYRDVRESMLSFMRFVHCNFEHGIKVAAEMMKLTDFYFKQHTKNIIRLRYERIIYKPIQVLEEIIQFLDLQVPKEEVYKISEEFSKKNVKKLIDSLNLIEITPSGKIVNPEFRKNFNTVKNKDGSFRIFHKRTAYQSNHIVGIGEKWRTELNEDQKKILMDLTSQWLTKYGFPL